MTTLGIARPLTVTWSLYFGPVDNPASLALPSESSFLNASPKPPKMFKDIVVDNGGDDDDNCTNATMIQWLSDTNTNECDEEGRAHVSSYRNPSQ
jgi:hypothetical protein